ncbi:MAG: DNA ligase D [Deltaproteobacteria bacterium]|nr:DNA ligase D [Deltaproteobacteria bacterium]
MAINRKLSSYYAKRDFSKTAEPSGENAVVASEIRRFVIQKHAASRLHYDFRLEIDGVLKSWAVTKGPSIDPRDKRLAVEVEDHPLDYGDFEGTIPQGQYGGGTVQLWDRGYWLPEASDPAAAIRKGELKFAVKGKRLRGGFLLVRIRNRRVGDKKNNWLLIKHRDQFARDNDGDALLAQDRSVASGRTMAQIAAGKGNGPKSFFLARKNHAAPDAIWNTNKARSAELRVPNPIIQRSSRKVMSSKSPPRKSQGRDIHVMPAFIAPQLCKLVERPPSEAGWVHEIKFDGYRIQARVEDGQAVLRTSKGLDWTRKFVPIARAAASLPNGIYDGEIVALTKNGVPDFGVLQTALAEEKTDDLIYFVFDLLFASGNDFQNHPLHQRKAALEGVIEKLGNDSVIRYVEHFDAAGESVLENARKLSLEGIVSKQLGDIYRPGQREWAKAKCRPGQEVVLGGWTSEGDRFRSLLAGVYRDNHLTYVGRVGTGFSGNVVKRILPRLKELTVDKNPFEGRNAPRYRIGVHWLKPELIAEIEFAGWTSKGNIRIGAFKGLREDKTAREVRVEHATPVRPVETTNQVTRKLDTNGAPKLKRGTAASVLGIVISNPEKTMWPDAGDGEPVTKLDLAHYYESVGEWIISYIKGRPCSIVRAPDGISGEHFFQRHAIHDSSKLLNTVTISGDHEAYLQINAIQELIAAAQIATLELHPWNCKPNAPEIPGRLVFDLDPAPGVDFSAVIQCARELRERLDILGLISFCKTTGGKGLHVVTPISQPKKRQLDWPVAKTFAETVVMKMAADSPSRYLTVMTKKDRNGKIFLDYLRNDRMSTAVALLSTRVRAGAPVSMPLDWKQVKPGLDPMRFTIRTAPELLARSTAWKDYADSERPLEDAIRRLTAVPLRRDQTQSA